MLPGLLIGQTAVSGSVIVFRETHKRDIIFFGLRQVLPFIGQGRPLTRRFQQDVAGFRCILINRKAWEPWAAPWISGVMVARLQLLDFISVQDS